jgi:riboflavin kinase/FMN adenylyltransferase
MKILSITDEIATSETTVVSVGNFDGIHRGHQLLIEEIISYAQKKGSRTAIVTFEPHTRLALYPQLPQFLLTTFEEKVLLVEQSGIDYLLKVPFTPEFSRLPPDIFLEKYLIGKLHMTDWFMGEGHSIGKDRSGGKKFLHDAMSKYHINIFTENLMSKNDKVISSTQIRKFISEASISEAVEMLGHPYLNRAERASGLKIGTQIGVPTLNFQRPTEQKVIPPPGVYAAELEFKDIKLTGALYYGDCPTFENREAHLEFHALEFDGRQPDIGEPSSIWLHRFIRNDQTFKSIEDLVSQMNVDIETIRTFFYRRNGNGPNQRTEAGISQGIR